MLLDYDWINIPLVYTQVVTLAVYTYFVTTLIGRQWIEPHNKEDVDLYFPALAVLEFFFYMGWLRVAETLINPFGDDDDDFEVVWMIDRHVMVAYMIVDKIYHEHPKLMKDQYWTKMAPNQLPHTLASEQFKGEYPVLSTKGIAVEGINAEILPEDVPYADGQTMERSRSLLTRFTRRRRVIRPHAELRRISTENTRETREVDNASGLINQQNKDDSDFTEFNKLRKVRRAVFKHKVMKYYQVLKEEKQDERKELLENLLSSSTESNLNNQ
ncbi:hypothetical protein ILUMI_06652 [Ignelater luminosus]|uniref:Bestrophin homolog n=1 Tax=Ignelater luminosus TaxID=2038154 RepID=A0A8K0GF52_IGNLU|nr:hypothetical protein ILUMI_06652 [Ignelater luminosus]